MKSALHAPQATASGLFGLIMAGLYFFTLAGFAASALAAQAQSAPASSSQSAPASETQLGVLVVTPNRSALPGIKEKKSDVKRSALNLKIDIGFPVRDIQQKKPPVQQHPEALAHPKPVIRTPASALQIVSPDYPHAAFVSGTQGSVTVRFTIRADGSTGNIQVISSAPPEVFDQATVQAVQQWRFNPATVDGQPVATTVTQTLDFKPPARKVQAPAQPAQTPVQPPSAPAQPSPSTSVNRVPANVHALQIVQPKYPPNAYRAQIGGSVTVQFTVGTDGKAHDIRILRSNPPRTFDRAVRTAIYQWRFKPVEKPTIVILTIPFTPPN